MKDVKEIILDRLNRIEQKGRDNEMQLELPDKVYLKKPKYNEGVSGDKKIIKEGTDVYQYIKVNKEWYKVKLEKA
tara:strand:- start:1325 stop:1549 length:225 start_codon:yes stop_codon:yes gene_type:complete